MTEETYKKFKCQNAIPPAFDQDLEHKVAELKSKKYSAEQFANTTCLGCQNLVVMCKITGEVKDFVPNIGCPKCFAGQSCDSCGEGGEKPLIYPTIRELCDVWYPHFAKLNNARTAVDGRQGIPKLEGIGRLMSGIKRSAKIAGISLDEPISYVTKKRLKNGILGWYNDLKLKKQQGEDIKLPSESTVVMHLAVWSNLTAKWVRELADDEGVIKVPKIELPEFEVHRKPWKKPTEAQYRSYKQYVERLEQEHGIEWAIVRFQRETGCRNGDVKQALWDNFSIRDGQCIYTYTDSKTGKTSPQIVSMDFFDKMLSWRRFYFSKNGPNKFFRKGHENDPHVFGSIHIVKADGTVEYKAAQNTEAWKRVNEGMRACGICDGRTDNKASYQNRALKAQELRENFGEELMNAVLHNSKAVSDRYSEVNVIKIMASLLPNAKSST